MSSASIFRDLPIVMRFSVIAASLGVSRRAGRIHRANAWRDRDFPVATLRQTGGRLGCRNRKHLAFRTGFRQTSRPVYTLSTSPNSDVKCSTPNPAAPAQGPFGRRGKPAQNTRLAIPK